ncbi:hypothetical protein B0H10DRAFT_1990066 [Mycena sp. CBHHK59/15]|nr:hypothetical protein B0H10DRAFT_2051919 [Mycena sp. CBHHK59/15]KAJ6628462.1 hypothetical protein B0H10DRAFT_1990066 [Mycena sp. CBHHK59/15]
MLFSRLLIAFSAAAVALSTPTKRTAADIESTLADLTQKVNALDTACKNLPASATVAQVYNIHSQAVAVGNSLQTGTTAVHNTAGPLAKADCDAIFSSVHALGGPISDTLSQIVAKYAVFKGAPLELLPIPSRYQVHF